MLQCVSVCVAVARKDLDSWKHVLQCVPVCYSVYQCVAVCCSVCCSVCYSENRSGTAPTFAQKYLRVLLRKSIRVQPIAFGLLFLDFRISINNLVL